MGEYKIVPYSPEFLDGSVKMLGGLWSKNFNNHTEYFKWKYHTNPYVQSPLGIITLYNNDVVGFRGYFATQWQAFGNSFPALVVGDTIVAEQHRRKGLSIAMGKKSCEEYASYYRFFINMEASPNAVPGYLRLGFVPILDKRSLVCSFTKVHRRKTDLIDAVEVFDNLKLKEMQNAVTLTDKISLKQDENFFQWRFESRMPNHYLFYYYKDDYIVVGHLPNHDVGFIVDYTDNDPDSFEIILRRIMATRSLNAAHIRDINLSKSVYNSLKKLKFKDNNIKNKNLCPILVRPTSINIVEEDWFLNGLDMRDISNWKLKGICSEWA